MNVRESMEQNKAEIISFKETLKRDETDLDERRKEIKKLEGNQTALQNHEKFKSRVSGKQQWSLTLRKYKPEMEEAEKKFTRVLNELELLQKTLEAKEEILSGKYTFDYSVVLLEIWNILEIKNENLLKSRSIYFYFLWKMTFQSKCE